MAWWGWWRGWRRGWTGLRVRRAHLCPPPPLSPPASNSHAPAPARLQGVARHVQPGQSRHACHLVRQGGQASVRQLRGDWRARGGVALAVGFAVPGLDGQGEGQDVGVGGEGGVARPDQTLVTPSPGPHPTHRPALPPHDPAPTRPFAHPPPLSPAGRPVATRRRTRAGTPPRGRRGARPSGPGGPGRGAPPAQGGGPVRRGRCRQGPTLPGPPGG